MPDSANKSKDASFRRLVPYLSLTWAALFFGSALLSSASYRWTSPPSADKSILQTVEGIAILLAIALAFCIWQGFRQSAGIPMARREGTDSKRLREDGLHPGQSKWAREVIPGNGNFLRSPVADLPELISYLIVFCFVAYLGLFFEGAYHSFYLQEHDFLNIAAGLGRPGWLITPYVNTGPTGSFLGHHFSPILLFLKPLFWLAGLFQGANYAAYMLPLFLGAGWGAILWLQLAQKHLRHEYRWLLPALAVFIVCNPLTLRLSLSFHFEVFVLPISAACLLLWRKPGLWPALVLLFFVKEDMALYSLLLLGSITVFERRSRARFWHEFFATNSQEPVASNQETDTVQPIRSPEAGDGLSPFMVRFPFMMRRLVQFFRQSRPAQAALVSFAYLIVSLTIREALAGSTGTDWSHYWLQPFDWKGAQTTGLIVVLLAGGWLALGAPSLRYPLLAIIAIHLLSQHPWHNSFQSHYVYSLITLIFLGMWRIRLSFIPLVFPLLAVAGMMDRSTPVPPFESRSIDTNTVIRELPPNSCIRSSKHIAVRIPLHSHPYPLYVIAGNPLAEQSLCFPVEARCDRQYILLESQDTPALHDCQMQELRFRARSRYLNLFEYVLPAGSNTDH